MTDSSLNNQQAFAPANNYWDNMSNWAKPVNANAFTQGTQALNSMGSTVNSENPNATGFTASSQGPTGGGFDPSASLPTTQAGAVAANTANTSTGTQNSGVGNTASETNSSSQTSAGNTLNTENALNKSTQSGQTAAQSSSGSGLFGGLGSALGSIAGLAGNQLGLGQQISGYASTVGNSLFGTPLNTTATAEQSFAANGGGFASGAFQNPATAGYIDAAGDSVEAGTPGAIGIDATTAGQLESGGTSFIPDAADAASSGVGGTLASGGEGGAIGGLEGLGYSDIAGLGGANAEDAQVGGTIGGTIGGVVGSIIPVVGTFIGAAVGGAIGSVVGGLFGPGAGTSEATTFGTYSNGTIQNADTQSKGGSTAPAITTGNQLASLIGNASSSLGFTPVAGLAIGGGYNSLYSPGGASDPGLLYVSGDQSLPGSTSDSLSGNTPITFNPQDASSTTTAYFTALSDVAAASGYTNTSALYDWFYGQPTAEGSNPGGGIPQVGVPSSTSSINPQSNSLAGTPNINSGVPMV